MITVNDIRDQGSVFTKYVEKIIQGNNPKRHIYYKEAIHEAIKMGVHIEGNKPVILLEQKRPNEPKEVREYRLATWKAVTKSSAEKILNTINKIFNPKFFIVSFPDNPKIIPDNEELGKYLTEDYGVYRSLWVFIRETLLKITLSDPNALCVISPTNLNAEGKEFYTPIPTIYRSENIVDFIDDEYYTL